MSPYLTAALWLGGAAVVTWLSAIAGRWLAHYIADRKNEKDAIKDAISILDDPYLGDSIARLRALRVLEKS